MLFLFSSFGRAPPWNMRHCTLWTGGAVAVSTELIRRPSFDLCDNTERSLCCLRGNLFDHVQESLWNAFLHLKYGFKVYDAMV